MIELVGSKVVARRPTDINLRLEITSEDDDDKMPTLGPRAPTEDADIDPYQTPVALTPGNRKINARVMAEPKNTAEELSDIEIATVEGKKKWGALTSIADKVCTSSGTFFWWLKLYFWQWSASKSGAKDK